MYPGYPSDLTINFVIFIIFGSGQSSYFAAAVKKTKHRQIPAIIRSQEMRGSEEVYSNRKFLFHNFLHSLHHHFYLEKKRFAILVLVKKLGSFTGIAFSFIIIFTRNVLVFKSLIKVSFQIIALRNMLLLSEQKNVAQCFNKILILL